MDEGAIEDRSRALEFKKMAQIRRDDGRVERLTLGAIESTLESKSGKRSDDQHATHAWERLRRYGSPHGEEVPHAWSAHTGQHGLRPKQWGEVRTPAWWILQACLISQLGICVPQPDPEVPANPSVRPHLSEPSISPEALCKGSALSLNYKFQKA